MDFGNMLGDSFAYAKEAVIGKWMQWLLLVIATILLALPLLGYTLKILRGENPAPEVKEWGTLFIDGIKYLIVSIIWAIPALIVLFATIGAGVITYINDPTAVASIAGPLLVGFIVFAIVAVITVLLSTIGIIRFARTGSMGEAFNFGAIFETIGKIGWGSYILAQIVLIIVLVIIEVIISLPMFIPVVGTGLDLLIKLVLIAPIAIFQSRYYSQLYDAAGTA